VIPVKNEAALRKMRRSNGIAAAVRDELARAIGPGMMTRELNDLAERLMRERGAKSAFLGYRGYPGTVCISVNEEVVHGIPGERVIQAGDVVSLDVGVIFEGYIGDTAVTVPVGGVEEEVLRLLETTRQALEAGIEKAVHGNRLSDISHAVEQTAMAAGFSVVREFVGHGVGTQMHEEPQIPNFGPPGKGPRLRAGMTLAIEPMVNLGGRGVEVLEDGWTVRTLDGKPSAHFEHTVAVGTGGAEILTVAENAE
jgi:methionyl aminopeptidase